MKTKFLLTAALAAIVFISCQKDDLGEGSAQEGQDTYIGITLQLPKSPVVRAFNGDANATEAESKLTSVAIGTWRDGDNAIVYTDIAVANLTNNNDGSYTATEAVKAKTGTNNIIVLANTAKKLSIQEINGAAFDAAVATITAANNFTMYSVDTKVLTGVVAANKADVVAGTVLTNATEVTLRRAVAKVVVTSSIAETTAGTPDGLNNGVLTNIVWNIANENKQMTVFPKFITGKTFVASNVKSVFVRANTPNTVPTTALPASNAAASTVYCLENARGTGLFLEENTTAVQVSAVFAPHASKYVSEITGTGVADAVVVLGGANMIAGTTFFVSKTDVGTIAAGTYFNAAAVANAKVILNATDADFIEYTGGRCFWPAWIHDGAATPTHGVLRNHMYSMNILSIKAPGFPSFPDSNNPIAADTWIQVDLKVEPWDAKNMGDVEL